MRALMMSLLVGLGVTSVSASTLSPDEDPSPARIEYDLIMAEYDLAMDAYRAAFTKLRESAAYKEARSAGDRARLGELSKDIERVDPAPFAARHIAAAKKHLQHADSIHSLMWATRYSRAADQKSEAIDLLLATHGASEAILPFARGLYRTGRGLGIEGTAKVKDALMLNPSKEVQAHALYGWAATVLGDRSGTASEAQKAQAEAAMLRVKELAPNSSAAMRVGAEDFEANRLQIGMEVPDIDGVDLDGVNFKLSDYRGKVVVIDFWGDW